MNRKFLDEFAHPPSQYRGAPFWAWNGKLDPDELRRQVRVMHRMGLGGFFMHSRVGLATEYLGPEWMGCVAACVDEAERLDMRAWLYDEDRWPSGAAGGLVTKNPKYRRRQLIMERLDRPSDLKWTKDTVAAFTARIEGSEATDTERLPTGKKLRKLPSGKQLVVFRVALDKPNSWYNGGTYLDTMSREAVAEFIRVTHEAYRERFGEEFGRRIPGIFTDEPNRGRIGGDFFQAEVEGPQPIPWTDRLPKVFRERYGYDLRDHLVELFLRAGGRDVSPVRRDYFDCTTHLFVDAFARQVGEWCEANGLEHTGHVLCEELLASQTSVVGSCMRFYEYMQAPGMDLLTDVRREYDTAKQVSSVARQFGRKWRLTETYGVTRWDFPWGGHKALGDWQVALGINLRCQHLSHYTMEGQAKRDYPASISYQSPWWELYPKVEDYFGRVNVAMSRGREVRDILVVYPVESTWAVYAPGLEDRIERLDEDLWKLRDTLLGANLDFDYGDEDILARHARSRKKRGAATLTVGQADYTTVVVPPMATMRRSTLEMLAGFAEAGGRVIFAGPPAECVNAEPSGKVAELATACTRAPARGKRLAEAVAAGGRRVSIADADGAEITPALYCLREDRDAWLLFICNTSTANFGRRWEDDPVHKRALAFDDVRVRLGGVGATAAPQEFDCETGVAWAADAREGDGEWEIRTSLPRIGSRLFVVPKRKGGKSPDPRPEFEPVRSRTLEPKAWDAVLDDDNVLVLDRPRFRVDGGRWRQAAGDILMVDRAVRDDMGLPHRGGQMTQPWARERPKHPKRATVELEYAFEVKCLPAGGPLHLGVERPDSFTIDLNGHSVSTDADSGWWTDRSLRRVPLDPAALRAGRNVLTLVCDFTEEHPGLEIVYLLGRFGVRVRGEAVTMTAAPQTLRTGDWTKQGLAFYGGNVCYETTVRPNLADGERLVVEAPRYEGVAVRVLVDGQHAGIVAWEPNEVDVTDLVAGSDRVTLGIQVLGSRRNSHGPLHLPGASPLRVGPHSFDHEQVPEYSLVACGLMAPPRLVWLAPA